MLAVIAPPTLLAGVIGGGMLGAFHHKGLGLKAADRERIASQLSAGQAAVGVLVRPAIAIDVSAKLTELGGTAEVHEVTEEAVAEVETAVPAVEAAETRGRRRSVDPRRRRPEVCRPRSRRPA